jgi:cell division ATPase FtsA
MKINILQYQQIVTVEDLRNIIEKRYPDILKLILKKRK